MYIPAPGHRQQHPVQARQRTPHHKNRLLPAADSAAGRRAPGHQTGCPDWSAHSTAVGTRWYVLPMCGMLGGMFVVRTGTCCRHTCNVLTHACKQNNKEKNRHFLLVGCTCFPLKYTYRRHRVEVDELPGLLQRSRVCRAACPTPPHSHRQHYRQADCPCLHHAPQLRLDAAVERHR